MMLLDVGYDHVAVKLFTWSKRSVALFSVLIDLHLYVRDADSNVTQINLHSWTLDTVTNTGF